MRLLSSFAIMFIGFGAVHAADLDAMSRNAKDWVMAPHDYANTRFSALDQINTGNAARLQSAWMFSNGAVRGQEEAPLVIDGTMYLMGPYPNNVFALDAATGEMSTRRRRAKRVAMW
jgi:alcohol dehydrogenase (cytochrome c)